MPAYRIGLGSDFNLNNQLVGIGTTTAGYKLTVANVLKGDFNITGVTTLTSYGGFVGQKQNISIASSVGFTTTGIGTVGITSFISTNEKDYGYISLIGEYNTVSEDIVVDEGRIFDISTITNIGITTLGTQSVYVPTSSVVNVGTLESLNIASHFSFPNGGITARPEDPVEGTVRFNDDLNTLEFYNGVEWRQFTVDGSSGRGIFAGGNIAAGEVYSIDYINIATTGNSLDFGTIASSVSRKAGCSDSTRGLLGGGSTASNVIDYLTIASSGNTIDFGDLTAGRYAFSACSSSTRGIFGGGYTVPTGSRNIIDYVQISTIGNALDFGDLTAARFGVFSCSSSTRGIFGGGTPTGQKNIEFITISSTGNAVTFGNLNDFHIYGSACSSSTRGIIGGGSAPYNMTEYITISSTGNSTEFGDLTIARETGSNAVSNSVRGVFGSGYGAPAYYNVIDYITITSLGNALDFGDMSKTLTYYGALSDSHGGLGGF